MVVLIIVMGVFALMNREIAKEAQGVSENAEIIIKDGNSQVSLSFDEINSLEEVEFNAVLDTSDSGPKENTYTGVLLKEIIEKVGMDIEDKKQMVVKALDGYVVALKISEVIDEDNVYLAYKLDGQPLRSKEQGGSGPYQLIIRKDQFSQRWCKFVVEIELK